MNDVDQLKKFKSRFGVVSVGKIQEVVTEGPYKFLIVDEEAFEPTVTFWSRYAPQRYTETPAPEPEEGEERQPPIVTAELDYTLGYYLVMDGGNDRYLSPEDFARLEPTMEEE